jgi:hypothetical protein
MVDKNRPARKEEEDRINRLAGNQARIMLLWLLEKGHLDSMPWHVMRDAFEIAESYSPQSELKSF